VVRFDGISRRWPPSVRGRSRRDIIAALECAIDCGSDAATILVYSLRQNSLSGDPPNAQKSTTIAGSETPSADSASNQDDLASKDMLSSLTLQEEPSMTICQTCRQSDQKGSKVFIVGIARSSLTSDADRHPDEDHIWIEDVTITNCEVLQLSLKGVRSQGRRQAHSVWRSSIRKANRPIAQCKTLRSKTSPNLFFR